MAGKLKIVLFFLFFSCNNNKNVDKIVNETEFIKKEKSFISQNINNLIDSVESFDMSKIPRPNKFRNIKIDKIKVGLLDSVLIENSQGARFLQFSLDSNDLNNFKSDYDINIVKIDNNDNNTLFVRFSNFKLEENFASIDVKKKIGISSVKMRYYFERKNNIWILKSKKRLIIG